MKFIQLTRNFAEKKSDELLNLLNEWTYLNWNIENILYNLPNKWDLSYVLYINDKIAGLYIGSEKIQGKFYLHLLYVSEKFRGQNIGVYLFNHIKSIAKKRTLIQIELRCPESNVKALKFYEREGCTVMDKIKDDVSGSEADYYLKCDLNYNNSSYIIAEVGNNHNGDLNKAKELILESFKAGVDAVKFQSFRGIDIVSPKVKANEYKGWDVGEFEFWYEFLDSIALKLEDHQAVIDTTLNLGMDFITTPTSPYIVEYLEKLHGIQAYKIASMDLTNTPLLKAVAKTNKKILISTGMGDIKEVERAAEYFKNHNLSILHCVSDYPLKPTRAFLNNILELKSKFPHQPIGFSDHSFGHQLCIAARILGATIFEKHITLDRKDKSPAEHHFSMEPSEFKELVAWLKVIDINLNLEGFLRSETEQINKVKFRRSYHYKSAKEKGTVININDLILVRPGNGISDAELDKVCGKVLNKSVNAYDACLLSDVIK